MTGEVTIFNGTIFIKAINQHSICILKVRSNYAVRHFLSGRQDSNLQPQAPKACILPIEILPEVFVETVGLEPTSSDFQSAALTVFATFPLSAYLDSNQGLPS